MLRSLAHGWRDFKEVPDTLCVRYNWIFLCLFDGVLQPRFDPPLPAPPHRGEYGPPNFWVIPPQTRYVVSASTRRCERAVFHFAHVPEILQNAARKHGYLACRLGPRQIEMVRTIVASIEPQYARPTALSEVRFEITALQLSLLALPELDAQAVHPLYNLSRERVEKAVAWYTEHMAAGPSLHDVAAAVHVSPSHLRRHFYERLGRSPKAVFNKTRLQRATKLLVGTMLTLEQIAEHCGFNTASDFCRAFKAHFHVTPNAWRRNVNSATPRPRRQARGRGDGDSSGT